MINIYFDQVKVGDVYNFSAPPDSLGRSAQGCENCNRQILEGTLVTGQVPITRALWMAPNVNELDENEVKQYLTQHLRWTVIMVGLTHPHRKVFEGLLTIRYLGRRRTSPRSGLSFPQSLSCPRHRHSL
jgi:Tyosinase C-terminal domain